VDPTLITLLTLFVAGALITFHLGFRHPASSYEWRIKAGFVVLTFMLIPVVTYVLATQRGATERLSSAGIAPLPSIRHAVGIAAGQGQRPVWVFRTDDEAEDVTFYDDPGTRMGWEIVERGPISLILRRGDERMSVTLSEARRGRNVVYMTMR
jgi:hypothetical protein